MLLAGLDLEWATVEGRELYGATFHSHTHLLYLAVVQMIFGVTREHKGNCVGRGEHFSSRGQSVTSTGFYSPLFSCRQRQERNTSGHFREQWAFPNPLSQQITSVCHSQGPAPPCLMRAVVLSLDHAEQKEKAKKCGCCPRCV